MMKIKTINKPKHVYSRHQHSKNSCFNIMNFIVSSTSMPMTKKLFCSPFLILNFHVVDIHSLSPVSSADITAERKFNENNKKEASNEFPSIKITKKNKERELPKMRNDHECESVKHYGRRC